MLRLLTKIHTTFGPGCKNGDILYLHSGSRIFEALRIFHLLFFFLKDVTAALGY